MEGPKKCVSVYLSDAELGVLKDIRKKFLMEDKTMSISELIREAIQETYIDGEGPQSKKVSKDSEQDDKKDVSLWDITLD